MSLSTLRIMTFHASTWLSKLVSFARDERVILVSIGITSYSLVRTIIAGLEVMREHSAIPPTLPKTRYITQDTEDALEPGTLDKLLKHPSFAIREIAIKILCERAVNNKDVVTHLLVGITRFDYDERMMSLRALAMLTGQTTGFEGLSKLNQPMAYSALVRSLELSLGDAVPFPLNDNHWDEYYLRDMTERFCLMFILELTNKYGASMLIKAKFVERWLSKQLWGGATMADRVKNFDDYMKFKDNRIVSIVNNIRHSKRGVRALEKAGLATPDRPRRVIPEIQSVLVRLEEQQALAQQRAVRPSEQSVEEQRLRRQHREAMVLNDGTRPFGRDDIIEPDHESAD